MQRTLMRTAVAAAIGICTRSGCEQVPTYGPLREPVPVRGPKPIATRDRGAEGRRPLYIYGARVANIGQPHAEARRSPRADRNEQRRENRVGQQPHRHRQLRAQRRTSRPPVARTSRSRRPTAACTSCTRRTTTRCARRHATAVRRQRHADPAVPAHAGQLSEAGSARAGSTRFPADSVAYLVVARFVDDVLDVAVGGVVHRAPEHAAVRRQLLEADPVLPRVRRPQGREAVRDVLQGPTHKNGRRAALPGENRHPVLRPRRAEGARRRRVGRTDRRRHARRRAVVPGARRPARHRCHQRRARICAHRVRAADERHARACGRASCTEAGARIYDFQYRFNKTAADAVRKAIGVAAQ